jgi:hypothetical protein
LPPRFVAVDLGLDYEPMRIANNGWVLLRHYNDQGDIEYFRWRAGVFEHLTYSQAPYGVFYAVDINRNGTVVGWVPGDDNLEPSAGLRWSSQETEAVKISAPTALPHYNKNNSSLIRYCYFSAVTDQETIFGGVYTGGGSVASCFNLNPSPIVNAHWWSAVLGAPTALSFGHPVNQDSSTAIYNWAGPIDRIVRANSNGRYIGTTVVAGEPQSCFPTSWWITPGFSSGMVDGQPVMFEPRDISEVGIVVGVNQDYTAMVISNPDGSQSAIEGADPVAINDHVRQSVNPQGEIVQAPAPEILGYLGNDPALWQRSADGTEYVGFRMQDLPIGTPGWEIWRVSDINDHGMIVGMGFYTDPSNPQAQSENRGIVLVPLDLIVDGNRDGAMSFNDSTVSAPDITSRQRVYRFWVNDDDDTELSEDGSPADFEQVPPIQPDFAKHQIVSKRNLEDFARLWINVGDMEAGLTSGSVQIALKWKTIDAGDPAINIYPSADGDGSDTYLTDSNAAAAQIDNIFDDAVTDRNNKPTVDSTSPFIFKSDYWNGATGNGAKKCLLFEGAAEGKGELEIVLLDSNGNQIAEGGSVWLDLVNVKEMYERAKATPENISNPHESTTTPTVPVVSYVLDPNGYSWSYPATSWTATNDYVVFVHGWDVTYDSARTYFAETTFKRLWQRGYKGRVAALYWPTLTGLTTYNESEYRAWFFAQSLKQYVDNLPTDFTKNVIAHSLGNMVAGSALRKGMSIQTYAMIDAAVPASCYDNNPDLQIVGNSPDSDTDEFTLALAYKDKFSTPNTTLTNFYLETDTALARWIDNNTYFKPQVFYEAADGDHAYKYFPGNPAGERLFLTFVLSPRRTLQLMEESLAYACKASTKAVGAEGNARGSIASSVDLSGFGYVGEHSAFWSLTLQKMSPAYDTLLDKLQVDHNQ